MKKLEYTEEVTLMQAIAEMYNFHPRSHKETLMFDVISREDDSIIVRIGTAYSKWDKTWKHFYSREYEPTFSQTPEHFLSNLFCSSDRRLIYGAQQGVFKVLRVKADTK